MKPIDVKSNTYINSSKKNNDEDVKFKIGNVVRISKYKNNFAEGYVPNLKKLLLLQKLKIFSVYKDFKKTNQKECRVEKVIKRKGVKLYVKWKEYNIHLIAR